MSPTSLPDFSAASILVAGDVMLDQYISGSTTRISPEAPIPVVRREAQYSVLGGAANVACNLSSIGASVALCGLLGEDPAGDEIVALMQSSAIDNACLRDAAVTTIAKLRVISRQQQLLRIDAEDRYPESAIAALNEAVLARLQHQAALVFSDYGKGWLTDCEAQITRARQLGIPVLVDPKGGDYSKYRGATVITPNRSELERIVGRCRDDAELFLRAEALRAELDLEAVLVTLSERGMALLQRNAEPLHLASSAREVFDVTGAGDTVIAVLSACVALGLSLPESAYIANRAAAIVVGKLGTACVNRGELQAALAQEQVSPNESLVSELELARLLTDARTAGERIVMTNGCFDLLHPGHLNFLNEVAREGDRLVVAVNTDASVQALKGEDRPVNTLADRMAMLAALSCVDWVVAFDEETPQRIISELLPDVLVKGGDYRVEDIVGYREVTDAGGEVKVLGFMEGYSSTSLIDRIKGRS